MFAALKRSLTAVQPTQAQLQAWMADANSETALTPDIWKLEHLQWHLVFVYGDAMEGFKNASVLSQGTRRAVAFTDAKYALYKLDRRRESYPIALEPPKQKTAMVNIGVRQQIDGSPYSFVEYSRHANPFAKPDGDRLRIKGELYSVRPNRIIELDKLYDNTVMFERKLVKLIVPYTHIYRVMRDEKYRAVRNDISDGKGIVSTHEGHQIVEAFMYVGKWDMWGDLLDAGYYFKPVRSFVPRAKWLGDFYHFTSMEYEA